MPGYADHTAVNGTEYFYVVSSTNACGESAGNSIESHGTPAPGFSFAPGTSTIEWVDVNGIQSGNLVYFDLHADIATLSGIVFISGDITLISNLARLPGLVTLNCSGEALATLDVSACPALTGLNCSGNALTVLAVNTILSNLVTNGQTGGNVDCSAQTPAAPPSVGPPNGIVAKAALLAKVPPWTVTTD
jgi:hypothetical protein